MCGESRTDRRGSTSVLPAGWKYRYRDFRFGGEREEQLFRIKAASSRHADVDFSFDPHHGAAAARADTASGTWAVPLCACSHQDRRGCQAAELNVAAAIIDLDPAEIRAITRAATTTQSEDVPSAVLGEHGTCRA
jgi:hypothetical protein